MVKRLTVTIKDHVTGETDIFETEAILGAFINELVETGSDTSQFIMGYLGNEKELMKLVAGCINMVYFTVPDTAKADKYIDIARMVASEGFKLKQNYKRGY